MFAFISTLIQSSIFILYLLRRFFIKNPYLSLTGSINRDRPFSTIAFSFWNHRIGNSNVMKSKNRHQRAIVNLMKSLLNSRELKLLNHNLIQQSSWKSLLSIFISRLFLNICYFALLTFCILVTYPKSPLLLPGISNTIILTFFNCTLPIIFTYITEYESYIQDSVKNIIILARSFLWKVIQFYIIFIGYFPDSKVNNNVDKENWEQIIGIKMFQLLWFDMIFTCMITCFYAIFCILFNKKL
jgi:hypothetical protein